MNPNSVAHSSARSRAETPSIERILRAGFGWSFAILFWGTLIPLLVVSFRKLPAKFVQKLIRWWGHTSLMILGVELRMVGDTRELDEAGARVIVCNHQSALDIVWGGVICPPDPLVIGKKEIAYIPILNAIWWGFRFIRIDRQNRVKAITSLKGIAETIRREKRSLIVAPEGTRTPTGEMLPFKKGPFHIAVEGGLPLVPVVIDGAFQIWPKTTLLPRPGVLLISILPPLSTEGLGRDQLGEVMSNCEVRMKSEFSRLRAMREAGLQP